MLTYSSTEKLEVVRTFYDVIAAFSFHKDHGRLNITIRGRDTMKSVALLKMQVECLLADIMLELGFSDKVLPYLDTRTMMTIYEYVISTNIHAVVNHNMWPIYIADEMTILAQNMVGYFTGKPTTGAQMKPLRTGPYGEIDESVKMSDEEWTEPFELADDCVFCQKMTDESVADRIAGFQWAMDKEVANRFGAGLGLRGEEYGPSDVPKHYDHDDTATQRREYHDKLVPFYEEHPRLFKVIPLIDLPLHLQRTLCIQWNHVVRDFIAADPRLIYRAEDDMYFYIDIRRSFSAATKRLIPDWVSKRETSDYDAVVASILAGDSHDFV